MIEKATNKLTLKTGNNILKLMGKANQARNKVKQELFQISKDPTYSLPKLPPNTNEPSSILTYCQILINDDDISPDSMVQNPLNANKNEQKKLNKFSIRHSSLSFMHESPMFSTNQDSNFMSKKKMHNQMNSLQNKYSFLEIAQTSDINYFITKKLESEIVLFMSGANKVISFVSQQINDPNFKSKGRINLSHISNYIMKINKSLENERQRTYEVKFADCDIPSFELSEKVDFLDSSVTIITPNSPPFSYLFVLNLVENEEIANFAKIIHQIRSMSKKDSDEKRQNVIFSYIITNFPIFRQICQICKKNCTFSVVLFLQLPKSSSEERETEKLVNLFCEKKKSFLTNCSPKCKSLLTENLTESNQNESSGNSDDKSNNYDADSYFADDSGGNEEEDLIELESKNSSLKDIQNETNSMIDRAESDIKEATEHIDKNTEHVVEMFNEGKIRTQGKNDEVDGTILYTNEASEKADDDHSSLFELLKRLNNSEKENKEKLEKINEIRDELKIMEENIGTIKARQLQIEKESEKVNFEILEIQKQTDNQITENEKMKKNVKEMIIRTAQLKSKYNDLLNEIHEKERKQREDQWRIITEKEKEMKIKVSQSESKWRKELGNRKPPVLFVNNKENQGENNFIDQKNETNQLVDF